MPFIQLSKISLAFGDRDILKDITLILTAGTKAALTGANGCGKSTLMKIVAGQIKADSGDIATEKDTSIAYLPQSGIVHKGKTLAEEAETAFAYGYNIIKAMDEVGEKMKTKNSSPWQTIIMPCRQGLKIPAGIQKRVLLTKPYEAWAFLQRILIRTRKNFRAAGKCV